MTRDEYTRAAGELLLRAQCRMGALPSRSYSARETEIIQQEAEQIFDRLMSPPDDEVFWGINFWLKPQPSPQVEYVGGELVVRR